MKKSIEQYLVALIDRIRDLSIENHVLKQMIRNANIVPVPGEQIDQILQMALQQPEADIKRREFVARRDQVLHMLDHDEEIERLLRLPTKGLPN